MKKRNKILIIVSIIVLAITSGILYYVFNKQDSDTTLTIVEKQWIDNNKNQMIDFGVINDIPIFNYDGNGVFLEFLDSLEEKTGLEFNKMSYEYGKESTYDYGFDLVKSKEKDDILIYEDNYVLVSNEELRYDNLSDIKDVTIGVLNDDVDLINKYLTGATNISLKTYKDITSLINSVVITDDASETNMIAVPRVLVMDDIISNDLVVAYDISEYKIDFVITLGENDKLNSILKKYYEKWSSESFEESFNLNFTNDYFDFKKVSDKEVVDFSSKRYIYGFVENEPYDKIVNSNLKGINNTIIKNFSNITGVDFEYEKFDSIDEMVESFNNNKIDFFFASNYSDNYDMDTYSTLNISDVKIAILSSINNNIVVNSFNSLSDNTVMTVKNSRIENILTGFGIKTKAYDNVHDLIDDIKDSSIIAIDYDTYNYYKNKDFKNYKVDYVNTDNSKYYFLGRDISANKAFNGFLDFYISFSVNNNLKNQSYEELISSEKVVFNYLNLIIYLSAVLGIGLSIYNVIRYFKNNKGTKRTFNKDEKIKYIDMLTSLKNRNYLNDNIDLWDNSEVYPQAIVIIDLNNVAYINDNYGHQEGDNVITEAANILIKTQIENSEIVRTNGNEFLIYLVGYDEKQIISYVRKLNKELKNIAHGFGAASGYSIISDATKTIDDAVNEATLDMRNNKEEANY